MLSAVLVLIFLIRVYFEFLSTKVTIDATEKTSGTAATPPVVSTSSIADNSLIEIFVDQIDTDNVAAGVKIYLIGTLT